MRTGRLRALLMALVAHFKAILVPATSQPIPVQRLRRLFLIITLSDPYAGK